MAKMIELRIIFYFSAALTIDSEIANFVFLILLVENKVNVDCQC